MNINKSIRKEMYKQLINRLREIADELDKGSDEVTNKTNSEEALQLFHINVIRPLLESRILKNVEVAKMLHVSPTTVATMIADGCLTTTSDGKVTEYHLWKYLTANKE